MATDTHTTESITQHCYHCGEICQSGTLEQDGLQFCCHGCLTVYELLGEGDLCNYYTLQDAPGRKTEDVVSEKFLILDDPKIADSFILYQDEANRQVRFYIPYMHCSSCIYLLQNLHKLNSHIEYSVVDFNKKTVLIRYQKSELKLSQLAQLLASLGYAPMLSRPEETKKKSPRPRVLEIGLAGFCFGNIMLFTFPEYLGLNLSGSNSWMMFFRYLSLVLSLPVMLFSAREFCIQAWAGLRYRSLNINIPVVIALIVIFGRSLFEVFTHTGAGYFDSLTGLVFFMLVGRYVQDRTIGSLDHDRDFRSYFPMAMQVERQGTEVVESLDEIRPGDILTIHDGDVLPMDGVLLSESLEVDYSFLTGENLPRHISKNEKIYAGGKSRSSIARYRVTKAFSQTQFASLWQNSVFQDSQQDNQDFLDKLSWYFTAVVLVISFGAFGYWQCVGQSTRAWDALSTALIVACPCALLLSATFARGFVMQRLYKKQVYLKSPDVLEKLRKISAVVFDKTGTLTEIDQNSISYLGRTLSADNKKLIVSLMQKSHHPLGQILGSMMQSDVAPLAVESIKETEQSIEGWILEKHVSIGTPKYLNVEPKSATGLEIVLLVDGTELGRFLIKNKYKQGIPEMFESLKNYKLYVLSGDREANRAQLMTDQIFTGEAYFDLTAQQKLDFVKQLETEHPSMVIGDGVNDAGALKQASVGVAVVEDDYTFSPANDIMLQDFGIKNLLQLLQMGKNTRRIMALTFVYSLLYNTAGLSFALRGELTPVLAAVLMPASSLGIIALSYLGSLWYSRRL